MKFTDRALKALKPKDNRYEIPETNGRGFRIRVYPSGSKSFLYRYRFGERARVLVYGEYPDEITLAEAHERHGTAVRQVKQGKDPGEIKKAKKARERADGTVEALAFEYIEHHAKKRKKWQDNRRILEKDVLPKWKGRKAKEITRRDVVLLLDEVGKRGGSIRERTRSVVSMMFRVGVRRGLVEQNPATDLESTRGKPRERVLTDEEIRAVWIGVGESRAFPAAKNGLRMLLVLPLRVGECLKSEWKHIDFDARTWFVPAENAKNENAFTLPLSWKAEELLKSIRAEAPDDCPYIFGNAWKGSYKPYNARSLSNMPKAYEHFGLDHWTLHDARRTISTRIREAGTEPHIAERILNHLQPLLVRTYDRADYTEPMRAALNGWADELKGILEVKQ